MEIIWLKQFKKNESVIVRSNCLQYFDVDCKTNGTLIRWNPKINKSEINSFIVELKAS